VCAPQTVPLLKSPARNSPSSHLCSPFDSPSTQPRLDGPTYVSCSPPAQPLPKPGPQIGNTRWGILWVLVIGFWLSFPSLLNSLPDFFPPTEYKMESNPGPDLLAAKFALVQRPLQPLSLLPQSLSLHDLRGLDLSFYDYHGRAKYYDGRIISSS